MDAGLLSLLGIWKKCMLASTMVLLRRTDVVSPLYCSNRQHQQAVEKGLRLLRSAKRLAFGIAGTFRRRTLNRRHPMLLRTVA